MVLRALYVGICLAGLAAFYGFVHWIVYGFSRDFGIGFGVGMALTAIIASGYISLRYGE